MTTEHRKWHEAFQMLAFFVNCLKLNREILVFSCVQGPAVANMTHSALGPVS